MNYCQAVLGSQDFQRVRNQKRGQYPAMAHCWDPESAKHELNLRPDCSWPRELLTCPLLWCFRVSCRSATYAVFTPSVAPSCSPPVSCTRVVLTVGDTFLDLIRECTSAFLAEPSRRQYYPFSCGPDTVILRNVFIFELLPSV